MTTAPAIDFSRFDALTFDCYGTLIDWEAGLGAAFQTVFDAHGIAPDRGEVLQRYARHEAAAEAGPYRSYRDVLAIALRGVAAEYGLEPTAAQIGRFAASVVDWPAFPDAAAALQRLHTRFRLGVLTNCDDDLFAASNQRLGITFDWVVTAQQVQSYKPAEATFAALLERVGLAQDRILHVAQSRFHDHAPAKRLGFTTTWIDRRHDGSGAGATPPSEASPDATYPDMASFAVAAVLAAVDRPGSSTGRQ